MPSVDSSYTFPVEHKDFFAELQALMKKHPAAAARFALADVHPDKIGLDALRSRPPELECVSTEWGVVCKPLSPQT